MRVSDIGEQELLKRLHAFCPVDVVGDDGAVLVTQPGKRLVVTTDVLVDGVHFSDRTTPARAAGWRAAAANLSDLAAMGAVPLGITVGLGIPGDRTIDWIEQIYEGITDCLQRYGTVIVGGDVVRSPITTLSITAFGEVDPDCILRRSAAQPGHAIVVTGVHGASRAGLELLLHPELAAALSIRDCAWLIQAHQYPNPRLDLLPIIHAIANREQPTNQTSSLAGMDSSDGLADAVLQICHASGVGAQLERSQIPIPSALMPWLSAEQAMQWALYGGEDFELVLSAPWKLAENLVDQFGEGAAIIGITTAEPEVWLVDRTGHFPNEQLSREQGFQHFSQTAG